MTGDPHRLSTVRSCRGRGGADVCRDAATFTTEHERVTAAIDVLRSPGSSAVYDGLYIALKGSRVSAGSTPTSDARCSCWVARSCATFHGVPRAWEAESVKATM